MTDHIDSSSPAFRLQMFGNKNVVELAPPPRFDYKTYQLEYEQVDALVMQITEALIGLEDKTGRYRYSCMSASNRHISHGSVNAAPDCLRTVVERLSSRAV